MLEKSDLSTYLKKLGIYILLSYVFADDIFSLSLIHVDKNK